MPPASPGGFQVIYCKPDHQTNWYVPSLKISRSDKGHLFSEWMLFESNNVFPGQGNDSWGSTKDVKKSG